MQVGMIGLGRMGANMVRRLMRGGHDCVVHGRGISREVVVHCGGKPDRAHCAHIDRHPRRQHEVGMRAADRGGSPGAPWLWWQAPGIAWTR